MRGRFKPAVTAGVFGWRRVMTVDGDDGLDDVPWSPPGRINLTTGGEWGCVEPPCTMTAFSGFKVGCTRVLGTSVMSRKAAAVAGFDSTSTFNSAFSVFSYNCSEKKEIKIQVFHHRTEYTDID